MVMQGEKCEVYRDEKIFEPKVLSSGDGPDMSGHCVVALVGEC